LARREPVRLQFGEAHQFAPRTGQQRLEPKERTHRVRKGEPQGIPAYQMPQLVGQGRLEFARRQFAERALR